MKHMLAAGAVFAMVFAGFAERAAAVCNEPDKPGCLIIWTDSGAGLCDSMVRTYLEELETWRQCLVEEVNADARQRADDVVRVFNCYAAGGKLCS